MHPNALLVKIRKCTVKMNDHRIAAEDFEAEGDELRQLVSRLDEWLSNGGFLPDDWKGSKHEG